MAKKPNQAAANSGYWENLRRQRRREIEERAQIAQEGYKNLGLGRLAGFLGLGPDIAELLTPPLVTPSASIKTKSMRPFPAGMTKGEMPPKDGKGLEYKYTSADFAKKFGISPAEQIAGDVMGPGAPVSALTKGAAAAVKGFNLSDLGAAASAVATGIFAGKRARNLPKLSYDRALEMEKAGDGKYRIYEETGFWKGPEGDWRFEIDDKDIKFKPEALKSFQDVWQYETPSALRELTDIKYAPITDVVEHPELFKAYPELKEYYIKVDPEGEWSGGGTARGYQSGRGEKVPLPGGFEETRPVIMLMAPTRESEIKRLEELAEQKKLRIKLNQQDISQFLKNTDLYKDEIIQKEKFIIKNQEALAGIEKQLQNLREGGQPDIPFAVRSTLTHELQHAVQDIENLPRGGSPAAAEFQTERAIEQLAEQTGKSLTEIKQAVASRNYTIAKIAALDKILYLRFLQRYKNSDNPTGSARLIENSSMNYGLKISEEKWLGPRPKRYKRKEFGDYLRRKAELYQAKIIDEILTREQSGDGYYNAFQDALRSVLAYEEKRGKVDVSQLSVRNYDPRFIGNDKFYEDRSYLPYNERLANPDEIIQPNWMAIPENILKNAIKRLSKEADQYVGEQKVLSKVEDATKQLEKLKRDNPFDYQTELYYRLAGEAEARAVQKRFEMATEGVESDRIPTAMKDYGGAYDRDPEQLAFYYPRDQVPSVPAAAAINVPKSDVGFTSPALRVIMESNREQLPKEQWLKFLKGNGVKDDELEFSGLGEWLKQQKGQVSRADLEEYMTTQNQLKIEEVVYGGMDEDVLVQRYIEDVTNRSDTLRIGDLPEFEDEIAEEVDKLVEDWKGGYSLVSGLHNNVILDADMNRPRLNTEDEARAFFENHTKNIHVVVDENGEFMRLSDGDISFFQSQSRADQEIEFAAESDARTMTQQQLREALNIEGDEKAFGPVKYPQADLSLPGQRDEYRELVLYWDKPGQPSMPRGYSVKENPTGSGEFTIVDEDGSIIDRTSYDSEEEAIEAFNKFFEIEKGTESLWIGSHQYTDKPNPLLHIRFSERKDSAGERILVIEEIQSDIAKRGQKEGFRPKGFEATNKKIKQLEAEKEANQEEMQKYADMSANEREQAGMTQEKWDNLILKSENLDDEIYAEQLAMIELPQGTEKSRTKQPGTPELFVIKTPQEYGYGLNKRSVFYGNTEQEAINNAKFFIKDAQERGLDRGPFIMDTKDYMELGLKRMILWASENGFEKIAWTTGEQQMKRYNQMVEGINELTVGYRNDRYRILGTGAGDENIDSGDITRAQLDDYVGERVANKIENSIFDENPDAEVDYTLIDKNEYLHVEVPVDDLKLPKDPRHFLMIAYDKVLKNAAQKLGKKYDAKVGVGEIGQPEIKNYHVIDTKNNEIKAAHLHLEDAEQSMNEYNLYEGNVHKIKENIRQPSKVWTLNLSEKLKSAAEKGLPYMAVVPPAAMMMNQEQDRTPINRAAARPIMENYAN
jgi:hypothetical protein